MKVMVRDYGYSFGVLGIHGGVDWTNWNNGLAKCIPDQYFSFKFSKLIFSLHGPQIFYKIFKNFFTKYFGYVSFMKHSRYFHCIFVIFL